MILGGLLGIFFVTILRRVMVEDKGLPFPESVAASEIHKAGQRGADAAIQLFKAMGVGRRSSSSSATRASSAPRTTSTSAVGKLKESFVRLGLTKDANTISAGGITTISAPAATPAYMGVGYIIGPELGALNFAGGLLAWGLFVPLLVFFLGPNLIDKYTDAPRASRTGPASRATSTATSSGPSRSAGCSSAPASRSGRCARTSSRASSAAWPT